MKITIYGDTYNVWFTKGNYANNNSLAVQAWCDEGPFATVTVNLTESKRLKENQAYLDINNCSELISEMEDNGYVEIDEQNFGLSGFCMYPCGTFTEKFFKECK